MRNLVDGCWYMVDSTISNWVKNVNNLRIQPGTTSVYTSPTMLNTQTVHIVINGKLWVIPTTIPDFTHTLSTLKNAVLYLLSAGYTHNPQALLIEPIKKI
jgi:hypothetical protein